MTTDEPADLSPPPAVLAPPAPPRSDVAQRAGRGVFWNAAFLPLKLLLAFGASIVVVRILRLEAYPLLVSLQALLATLGVITDLGVERALPRYIPEVEIREGRVGLSRFLWRVGVIKTLTLLPFVALLILVPGPFLAQLPLADPAAPAAGGMPVQTGPFLLALLGILLVLGAISDVSIQVLYAYFKQKITNTLDVINAIVIPTLRVAFIVGAGLLIGTASAKVIGALLALLLGTLLAVILSVGMMVRALRQEHSRMAGAATAAQLAHLPPAATFWRRFSAYSAILYILNLSVYLYSQPFVVLMIPAILPGADQRSLTIAGLGVAYSLVRQLLQSLVTPMNGVQTPLFARLHAENRLDALRTSYDLMSKVLILALVPAGVGMMALARNGLLLYLQVGRGSVVNAQSLPAITVAVVILVVGLFGKSVMSVALLVLLVFEKYRAVLVARLTALVSIPLLFLLVPGWGMIGAALAIAAAGFLSRLVSLIYGQRELGLHFPLAFLGRVSLVSVVMGAVVLPLALLVPDAPLDGNRVAWLAQVLAASGALALLGIGIFYAGFRLLGGLAAADKQRFATLRLPFIGRALKWL